MYKKRIVSFYVLATTLLGKKIKCDFEKFIQSGLMKNMTLFFIFGLDRMSSRWFDLKLACM